MSQTTETKTIDAKIEVSLHLRTGLEYDIQVHDFMKGKSPHFYNLEIGGFSLYVAADNVAAFKAKMLAALEQMKV